MMEGSVLEAMAEAVEQAACVVVCLSPEYKVCVFCRSFHRISDRTLSPCLCRSPTPAARRASTHIGELHRTVLWQKRAHNRVETDIAFDLQLEEGDCACQASGLRASGALGQDCLS